MRRPLLLILPAIAVALAVGHFVRARAGLELSAVSIQRWVDELGWAAPVIYLGLVTFRHFLFLPSTVILPAGGLCFGAAIGAALGALGIILTGLGQFALVRVLRPRWMLSQVDRTVWGFERLIERAGPWLVALATGLPAAPMSAVHLAAALSPLSMAAFAVALSLGAVVRASTLAFFGSVLLDVGSPRFYLASLLLVAAFVLPLLIPGLRRRLFGTGGAGR
jgi:uncharacterized membrane protein YdjX (TVP38/TMEM64 family)